MTRCFDFRDKYSKEDIKALEKMHTKQLLKERNRLYYVSEYCNDCASHCEECDICSHNQEFNIQEVKRILATREHVLNKKEAKELRKKRIKEGR